MRSPKVIALGIRLRRLSNVFKSSLGGWPKINYFDLLCFKRYRQQHDSLVQTVKYSQSNLYFMVKCLWLKIKRRNLTVLYFNSLSCCSWLHLQLFALINLHWSADLTAFFMSTYMTVIYLFLFQWLVLTINRLLPIGWWWWWCHP
jgi:hypothetical protein